MCLGRRSAPTPPPLPAAEPVDSAIEKTAIKVAIGDDRSVNKKKKTGKKVTGGKIARAIAPKRLGTRSLQIPLLPNTASSGNLNYS